MNRYPELPAGSLIEFIDSSGKGSRINNIEGYSNLFIKTSEGDGDLFTE
jgi:hypothetical protein